MNILNTHHHRLIFRLEDAFICGSTGGYREKWNELKIKCQSGESGDNNHIVEQMKEYSKLEINKELPYLERAEGGLGGDNNLIHKQIR